MGLWLQRPIEYCESKEASALNRLVSFCLLPLGTQLRYSLSEPSHHAVRHPRHTKRPCTGTLVNTQPQLLTMRESCLKNPVHLSLQPQSPSEHKQTQERTTQLSPFNPQKHEMINCCFKSLNFGEVYYNQISLFQLVICVNQDNTGSLSEWLCLHEETIRNFLLFFVPVFSHLGNTKVGLDQGHSLEITMERKYFWKPDETAHLHVKKPH